MVLTVLEVFEADFQVPTFVVFMEVDSAYGIVKVSEIKIEEVFVHDDDIQAIVKRIANLDVKKDVGINEQKLVDTLYVLDINDVDIKKEGSF